MTKHSLLLRSTANMMGHCNLSRRHPIEIEAARVRNRRTGRGPAGPSEKALERQRNREADALALQNAERNRRRRELAAAKKAAAAQAAVGGEAMETPE